MSRQSSRSERDAFLAGGDPIWNGGLSQEQRQDSWGTMFSAMSLNSNPGSEIGTPPQAGRGLSQLQVPSAGRLTQSPSLQSRASLADPLGLPPRTPSSRSQRHESFAAFLDRTLSDIGPMSPHSRGSGQESDRQSVDRRHALMQRTVSGRILSPSPQPLMDCRSELPSSPGFVPPRRPVSRRSMFVEAAPVERRPPYIAQDGGIIQPRTVLQRDPPAPPQPRGAVAIHVAIYEGRVWNTDRYHQEAVTRRNVSIIAGVSPSSDKFREFCCIPAPSAARQQGRRHIRFYSTPEIPDPRTSSPGLLAMYFVGWVPASETDFLDAIMKEWRGKIRHNWTLSTWIELYLAHLVTQRYIPEAKKTTVLALQDIALRCDWVSNLPNNHGCFPELFRPDGTQ